MNEQETTKKKLEAALEVLGRARLNISNEAKAQVELSLYFQKIGLNFEKEYRLDEGIVDFFLPDSGIAIELKVDKGWSKTKVFRQCERYCQSDEVHGIILATGAYQGLPEKINGKPALVFQMGQLAL
ncbi:hypothetical protein [Vibrio barjaei]|uniref:hypothetical protein n=1 Tax=Vibrio barjaei TaxID=1676683 RepID=UPI00228472EF|nr:hypothetical protein [Vibrio barjaei]MCY9870345.1 hypothetical protein [Vibrio barjaei]